MTIAIPTRFQDTLTVYRKAVGSYVAGRWVPGTETFFDIICSSQPLTGSELRSQLVLLPEGSRKREMRKLYTDSVLQAIDPPNKIEADEVDVSGVRFEVMSALPHTANANSHMKVILAKVNI